MDRVFQVRPYWRLKVFKDRLDRQDRQNWHSSMDFKETCVGQLSQFFDAFILSLFGLVTVCILVFFCVWCMDMLPPPLCFSLVVLCCVLLVSIWLYFSLDWTLLFLFYLFLLACTATLSSLTSILSLWTLLYLVVFVVICLHSYISLSHHLYLDPI